MNTDQIAAEAARHIQRRYPRISVFEADHEVARIIQGAIGKATEELTKLREGDNILIRALAEDAGIQITAPDNMLGLQWEQFHDGVMRLKRERDQQERFKWEANKRADRPAHASEPFDAAKHHPSCTPNDQDLMWVCAQCGHKEPAGATIEKATEEAKQNAYNDGWVAGRDALRAAHASETEFIQCPSCGWHPVRKSEPTI